MRAVLDPNVLISAALARRGTPAELVRAWLDGSFDVVVSPALLDELTRALAYPKLRRRIPADVAAGYVEMIRQMAIVVTDLRDEPPVRSIDPGDDYLIALARASGAVLVSGDGHLLALRDRLPVFSPADFREAIRE